MVKYFTERSGFVRNKENNSYIKFEELLKENKMNIPEVAKILNIPIMSLYDWKNGKSRPKLEKLLKIAKLFNVDVSEFTE